MAKSNHPEAACDREFFRNIGFALLTLTLLAGSITLKLTLNSDALMAVNVATNTNTEIID